MNPETLYYTWGRPKEEIFLNREEKLCKEMKKGNRSAAKIVLFCRFVYNGKDKNEQVLWDCCIDEGEEYEKIT